MNNTTITLNTSQQKVFEDAINWWRTKSYQTFEISGPPGSGKTFLINKIIRALNIDVRRIAPMAYTGSAAINMRTKGMSMAKTIFSWLYDFKKEIMLDKDGNPILDPVFQTPKTKIIFIPKKSLDNIDLIIVDEAGTVPVDMRRVIDSMNIPVIAAGDLDQLPPIFGTSGYLNNVNSIHFLNEIMRQASNNTIIQFSQMAIKGIDIPLGRHGNVDVIYEDQLTDEMIANSDILICSKNSTRDHYISHIRHDMLNFHGTLPSHGERLVCRKNNWNIESGGISLTNGLLGSCINSPDLTCFNFKDKTFKMCFRPDLAYNSVFENINVDYYYLNGNKEQRDAIKDKLYSKGDKFEYGYAITTHMSQGSEFRNGIYIEEFLNKNINRNLNYVGLTRFREHCIYVKRRPKKYW